jgi:hypothetical protein
MRAGVKAERREKQQSDKVVKKEKYEQDQLKSYA